MRTPRFLRRRKGSEPASSPAPDPAAWSAYRNLRATSPDIPLMNDSGWVASFPPAGAAAGGPLEGSLDGWNVEMWQGLESDSAGAIVMSPDHNLHALLVYERQGGPGGLLTLFAPDGSRSYHNAPEGGSDLDAVVEVLVSMAWELIAQHVGRELGILPATDRVRAAESPAFVEFARQGPAPLVASWLVAERIPVGESPDRWIELWVGTVDLQSDPPNPYHTPLVASAIDDGHIRGMVAVEIMPGLHDELYVILFDGHQRTSVGSHRDLPSHPGPAQLASFRQIAVDLLTPLLPEGVWHQAALLSEQEPAVVLVPRWHVESDLGSVGPGQPVSWFVRAVWPTPPGSAPPLDLVFWRSAYGTPVERIAAVRRADVEDHTDCVKLVGKLLSVEDMWCRFAQGPDRAPNGSFLFEPVPSSGQILPSRSGPPDVDFELEGHLVIVEPFAIKAPGQAHPDG